MTAILAYLALGTGIAIGLYIRCARAPLVDENERLVDEVHDDPRPAQVLRERQRGVRL